MDGWLAMVIGEILLAILIMFVGVLLLYFGLKNRKGCCNEEISCDVCPKKEGEGKEVDGGRL
jgi:hypothetical protein